MEDVTEALHAVQFLEWAYVYCQETSIKQVCSENHNKLYFCLHISVTQLMVPLSRTWQHERYVRLTDHLTVTNAAFECSSNVAWEVHILTVMCSSASCWSMWAIWTPYSRSAFYHCAHLNHTLMAASGITVRRRSKGNDTMTTQYMTWVKVCYHQPSV